MPEMILGLDIGDAGVKAVLAARKGRSEVHAIAFETVSFGDDTADLEAALKRIAETLRPQMAAGVRCVVSLAPADIMFRHIKLPFRDENKIRKTLPFELESVLPMPFEEVVADYTSLPQEGLLVAACGREKIRKVIAAVEANLGPVAVIDVAAAVLVMPLLEQNAAQATGILLDIGALSSVAVFYEKNAVIQIRSFSFGGESMTRALAQDLSCEPPEAEKIKISASYGNKIDRADAACRQFCIELANTVEFLVLNEILQTPLAQITVSGGGALFQPLGEMLEKTFGVPVDGLDLLRPGQSELDARLKNAYPPQIMNTALATAKRAFTSRKSFNLRQGEFETKNILGDFRTHLKWGAVAAGIIILLAATDQFLDYRLQSQQASALKNQISRIFKKHYSPAAVMVDPVAQLKTKLAEDKKMYGLDGGSSDATMIGLLKEMSTLIPTVLDIVITHFHYENNMVLVKGEAKKIDDISVVKNELSKSKYFKAVTVGSTRLSKEGTRVDFDLRIELQ